MLWEFEITGFNAKLSVDEFVVCVILKLLLAINSANFRPGKRYWVLLLWLGFFSFVSLVALCNI